MYDGIIFDIDGTLWNACPNIAKGYNSGLASLGLKKRVSSKQIEELMGVTYDEYIEALFPEFKRNIPGFSEIIFEESSKILKKEGGSFYPGVIDGLKKLSNIYPIFLISNCQEVYLHLFLKAGKLEAFFKDTDCYGISKLHKSEMIENMKQRYELKKAVYVGDTAGDEVACELTQTKFIYMSYGFGSSKNNPLSFSSFKDLTDYFIENIN